MTLPTNQEAAKHAKESVRKAWRRSSKLTDDVSAIEGKSSSRVKCLLNNLCSAPWASYLEIGCWMGSTLCAAVHGNNLSKVVGIDNYNEVPDSEGHTARANLHRNSAKFITGHGIPLQFIAEDFRSVDPCEIGQFTVYYYDGAHGVDVQKAAFTHMAPALADVFVVVVGDWNMQCTKLGTQKAFAELGWGRIWEAELPANRNGDLRRWWNGLLVAVIDKRQSDIRLMLSAKGMVPEMINRWMSTPLKRLEGFSPEGATAEGRAKEAFRVVSDLLCGRGGIKPGGRKRR